MKQIALDIGLASGPTLQNFFAGPNGDALSHLSLWLGQVQRGAPLAPVPLYLWGPAGSGKTHLLQAVRSALLDRGASVGWLDPSVTEPSDYQGRWSVVLMDDVHLYTVAQQHAAFNWFVNAQTHQVCVLGAGNLPPADLPLRDDLRSRLAWGHVFALQLLGDDQRRAVLRHAADGRGLFLSDEVMDFMLTRFSRDLSSLMALLEVTDRYALQERRAVTVPMIKAMMDEQ